MTEIIPHKPRILILSLTYSPFIGGAEMAVQEIAKRLKDEFEFDLITAKMQRGLKKQEKIENVNVYRLGFGCRTLDKYIYTFFGFFKALKLHLKNKYYIIWPIMVAYSTFAVLFKIFFPKVKILLTLQEGDPIEYIMSLKRFKIFWPIYKFYFKKVDKVQVISNYLAKWAVKLGVYENKIVIIPNGVDSSLKHRNTETQKHIISQLNFKDNEKVILTVSRLVEKNGVEDLIKAYKLLVTDYWLLINKLLIVGNGPLRNKLENLVRELEIGDKVVFVGDVEHNDVYNYYQIANVFVRPSLSEGFGNVFIEAMAVDVPVIATHVGGIPDFLKDGQTGWFCKVKNPLSIAEKIGYVLDKKNKDEIERVVRNARNMVEEKYDWDMIVKKMSEVFNILQG